MPTLQLTLISAAIAGAIGFGSAWKIQSLRADSLEKTHVEQKLAQEQEARRFDQARSSSVISAQNAGAARAIVLRADADAARGAVDGMRIASSRAVSAARADPVACVVTTVAQSVVLDSCASEYQAMAGVADRHASDVQTMMSGWPK